MTTNRHGDAGAMRDPGVEPGDPGRVLAVLPTYDERGSLADLVSRLREAVPEADVLIVDDASPDGTGELADELASADSQVAVLHRVGKQGLGTAYLAGFDRALAGGYRWVVEMDADGSHLPEELPRLLRAGRSGAGLVLGCRWIRGGRIVGWPWYRRLISRCGTRVARAALRSRLRDLTTGFRVIDTRWLERIDLSGVVTQGYGFQVELAWRLERIGCPIDESPITFVERQAGRSKMSTGIVAEAFRLVLLWGWRLRFGPGGVPGASDRHASESEITP